MVRSPIQLYLKNTYTDLSLGPLNGLESTSVQQSFSFLKGFKGEDRP